MSSFIVISIFCEFLFIISLIYYFLRSREVKLNIIGQLGKVNLILKCIIPFLSLVLMIFLCINTNFFTYTPKSLESSPHVFISIMCIVSTILLFIYSFQLTPKYIIELDRPSRLKSRKGPCS